MASDFYKTLGVDRSASHDEIAKAYRKLARKHHPDLNPDDKGAKKRFQEIQTAYDTLNDPEKRKMFDQFGSEYEKYRGGNPFGGGSAGQGPGGFDFGNIFGNEGGAGAVDLGDIFRQFGGGGAGSTRSRRAANVARGADIAAELEVPIRTVISGGDTQIQLDRNGTVESIQVKIPAGVEPGKKIRLRGQGQPVPGGKAGDLLLTIKPQTHPALKIVGSNLELRLPITLPEAIQGAKIDVPTAAGTIALTIPPMSSSGKKLRIKGQGLKSANGVVGDMLVELQIKLPEQISVEVREQLQLLADNYPRSLRDSIQW